MTLRRKKVSVPDDVMAREVGGEMVILNLDNEQYYGLDEIGARMWALITTCSNLQEALDTLYDEYEVEIETLQSDLEKLIDELKAEGLLHIHDI